MDTKKRAMVEALESSLGIVSDAAKAVGISRQTHYNWYNEDEEYKALVDDVGNASLDFAESKLFEKIAGVTVDTGRIDDDGEPIVYKQPPSDTAIIFFLKTKGKHRGYVERQEVNQHNTFENPPALVFQTSD